MIFLDTADPFLVILTALEVEYGAVRGQLVDVRTSAHPAGTLFEIGRLRDGDGAVAIAAIGAGNRGAAVLAERAIAMFQPRALLFVGVAGALRDNLAIGDVVVATKVYTYEGGKSEGDQFLSRPRAWDAPHGLEQLARQVARTGSWVAGLRPGATAQVHFLPIAAGEVVINSRISSLAQHLHRVYNDAAAVEMESAGISEAGHLNRALPVLTIRGISDKADGHKAQADNAGSQSMAAEHAAAFAAAVGKKILRAPADNLQPQSTSDPQAATQYVTALSGGYAFGVMFGTMNVTAPDHRKDS